MTTPFELSARCELRNLAPGRSTAWTAIRVDPRGRPLEVDRAPLALVLVVDTSGSMAGDPIAHARASCALVADLLDERDQLAVVTFGSHAAVLHGLTAMTAAARSTVTAALATMTTDGSTNLHGGLQAAAGLLAVAPPALRRVAVVLSDGQPNVGLATAADLAGFVATLRPIGVSTLGFGLHHDEDVLAAIADAGSGRYAYVPDPVLARVDLARAALAHGGIVADSLELVIEPGDGVELVRLIPTVALRHGRAGATAAIGDVFVDEGRLYAAELAVDAGPAHRGRLATVTVRGRAADGTAHQATATVDVDVRAGDPVVDPAAARDVITVQAEVARVEARAQADRGAAPAGATLLRAMIAQIDARPWFVANDGSPLAELREQLADEAANYERDADQLEARHQRKATLAYKAGYGPGAPRTAPPVAACLVGVAGPLAGQRIALWAENVVGRGTQCEVMAPHGSLSRAHARIIAVGEHFVIQDLGSTNGTVVNGLRVTSAQLAPGDTIALGELVVRFEPGP